MFYLCVVRMRKFREVGVQAFVPPSLIYDDGLLFALGTKLVKNGGIESEGAIDESMFRYGMSVLGVSGFPLDREIPDDHPVANGKKISTIEFVTLARQCISGK